jgi:LysR family glycine cleavage system transcriptional activator
MAESEIIAGRLIQPFATRLPIKLSYHLVSAPQKANLAKIVAFREWVLAESAYLRAPEPAAR